MTQAVIGSGWVAYGRGHVVTVEAEPLHEDGTRGFTGQEWGDGKPTNRMRKFECSCGVILRATVRAFKGARCLACGEEFLPGLPLAVGRARTERDSTGVGGMTGAETLPETTPAPVESEPLSEADVFDTLAAYKPEEGWVQPYSDEAVEALNHEQGEPS